MLTLPYLPLYIFLHVAQQQEYLFVLLLCLFLYTRLLPLEHKLILIEGIFIYLAAVTGTISTDC